MNPPRWLALGLSLFAFSSAARSEQIVLNRRIERNQTVARALHDAGIATAQVEAIIQALTGVLDFRHCRSADQLRLVIQNGALERMDYRQSAFDEWQVRRDGDRWVGSKREVEIEKKIVTVELAIDSSVYQATLSAQEDPSLALALADVFAWDIDFYQDVRKDDRARIVIEKLLVKGRTLRYGELLAASYRGALVGEKRVFRYQLPSGETSYFQQDGSSARKAFLKSPLKYANVTSRFGSRFHPILQYVKAHNGVDYAAAVGTPVWSVADGTVVRIGTENGSGRMICIRHPNGLETCYLHLSSFAPRLHVGARVQQKQVIAYSGNTGLSTGPHLHFAMRRGGRFINPLNQRFPRAAPLPKELWDDFGRRVSSWVASLEVQSVAEASRAATVQ